MAAKNTEESDLPAGVPLDWTQPEHPEAPAPEDVADEPAEDETSKSHVDQASYIAGLELELVLYGFDKERKAAITAELDRVRGSKAVNPPKETR